MLRATHNKKWKEFKETFECVLCCDSPQEAMRILNGKRAGYLRAKNISKNKFDRIESISNLIKVYK